MGSVNISGSGGGLAPWISLVGVVVGAIVGGGFSLWASRSLARRAEKKETRALRVARLEEAVQAVYDSRRSCMRVMMYYDDWLRTGDPSGAPPAPPHDRLQVLLRIFAPECGAEFEAVNAAAKERDRVILTIRRDGTPGDEARKEALRPLVAASMGLDGAFERLLDALVKAVHRELAG